MRRKFVVAMMMHETNTFSPVPTPLESFGRLSANGVPRSGGDAIAELAGTNTAMAAFLDRVSAAGGEVSIPVAGSANPSGRVADTAFEAMSGAIVRAVAAGCDAVLLDLHGAMATESLDDGEGELLQRLRRLAPELPIAVALDFHAQITEAMVSSATIITGYRTYPHIDMYETGDRAATTLFETLEGKVRPKIIWGRRPILSSTLRHTPSRSPMKEIVNIGRSAEAARSANVLNVTAFGGFPQADIPHLGLSVVAVCDQRTAEAEILINRMLDMAWLRRAELIYEDESLQRSIERAAGLDGGPIILVDHGDNTASGGTQDVMSVVAEALRQGLEDVVAGPICDPQAVAQLIAAGVGAEVTLEIGGRIDMPALQLVGRPLRLTGRVRTVTDGSFTVTGPMLTGMRIRMGRTVVFDVGSMQLVISENRAEPFDLGVFTHCGIDPRRKRFVLIKSRQHFRAGFEPIARHIVECAGDGVTSSDFRKFTYTKRPVPLYPLEPDMQLGRNEL